MLKERLFFFLYIYNPDSASPVHNPLLNLKNVETKEYYMNADSRVSFRIKLKIIALRIYSSRTSTWKPWKMPSAAKACISL